MATAAGFHMKGNAWRGIKEYISRELGFERVMEHLKPETQTFLSQTFIASIWYDVRPVTEITTVGASLTNQPHPAFCRAVGTFIYERDMTGIYRAILKFASPELMVKALPLATTRYFDFVKLETTRVGPKAYDVLLMGVPSETAATYTNVTSIFIERAITGSGGKNVTAQCTPPVPAGLVNGTPTAKIVRQLRWE